MENAGMLNNKGFTLVEILSTIVIIAMLMGIGIPGIMKISERMNVRAYNTKVDLVEQSAKLWGQDHNALLRATDCTVEGKTYKCKKIKISELIEEDYLDSESKTENVYINPKDDSSMLDKCVYVYKKNNRVYSYYDNGAC